MGRHRGFVRREEGKRGKSRHGVLARGLCAEEIAREKAKMWDLMWMEDGGDVWRRKMAATVCSSGRGSNVKACFE